MVMSSTTKKVTSWVTSWMMIELRKTQWSYPPPHGILPILPIPHIRHYHLCRASQCSLCHSPIRMYLKRSKHCTPTVNTVKGAIAINERCNHFMVSVLCSTSCVSCNVCELPHFCRIYKNESAKSGFQVSV